MTDPDAALVRRLITTQFPRWADLSIMPVEMSGWDNRTFRLGRQMSVRLPSGEAYEPQVEKEHRWLPKLAPFVPLPIPLPLGMGVPGEGYPWRWSVYPWLEGQPAAEGLVSDLNGFAFDLAQFLSALQGVDASGGPEAGKHNFYRGGSLEVYDQETRRSIEILSNEIDATAVMTVWEEALASVWAGPPVWVHGDVAKDNLLVNEGRLSAVIDFGCLGIGDPACDLVIAWTFLRGENRESFRAALALDAGTWARGRGWALWKALITILEQRDKNPAEASMARYVLDEVVAGHEGLM